MEKNKVNDNLLLSVEGLELVYKACGKETSLELLNILDSIDVDNYELYGDEIDKVFAYLFYDFYNGKDYIESERKYPRNDYAVNVHLFIEARAATLVREALDKEFMGNSYYKKVEDLDKLKSSYEAIIKSSKKLISKGEYYEFVNNPYRRKSKIAVSLLEEYNDVLEKYSLLDKEIDKLNDQFSRKKRIDERISYDYLNRINNINDLKIRVSEILNASGRKKTVKYKKYKFHISRNRAGEFCILLKKIEDLGYRIEDVLNVGHENTKEMLLLKKIRNLYSIDYGVNLSLFGENMNDSDKDISKQGIVMYSLWSASKNIWNVDKKSNPNEDLMDIYRAYLVSKSSSGSYKKFLNYFLQVYIAKKMMMLCNISMNNSEFNIEYSNDFNTKKELDLLNKAIVMLNETNYDVMQNKASIPFCADKLIKEYNDGANVLKLDDNLKAHIRAFLEENKHKLKKKENGMSSVICLGCYDYLRIIDNVLDEKFYDREMFLKEYGSLFKEARVNTSYFPKKYNYLRLRKLVNSLAVNYDKSDIMEMSYRLRNCSSINELEKRLLEICKDYGMFYDRRLMRKVI